MVCPAGWLQSIIWISVMTTGLQCEQYGVSHIISRMCAVQQSTVLIPCKYTHPKHERVSAMSWLYEKSPEEKVRVLSTDPVFKGRVEFVESSEAGRGNCSLLLKDVRKDDEGIFHFVFRMENSEKNWTNIHGIHLEITDAEVEIQPDVVMEGDGILLTCGSCIPSIILPTYIWMKEGRLLSQHHGNNILYLDPVKLEDGGQYSCTISGHERLTSSTVNISVIPGYPPENVSVSISGSGETVLGDSVTLTCSSDSNPPVLNYTWFKENETSSVGSGQSYSALQSGFFYCVAQNQHGSRRSAAVSITFTENGPSLNIVVPAVVITSVILTVATGLFIRRKRVPPSEEQNSRGLQHNKKIESPEDTYMTLDPMSRCSDYDTLHNVKRSCSNTGDPEVQEPTYYNTDN
ncbi:B-cell receptor CD22 isoform X2 [Myxocyprinus asiaticus]|uniref:B-cell receptor CD22 isoform X2 n=1 Tax=Myxocyprinus asiaticus TaxID=70543 RepID=UPI00222181AC|nr:B-cell receptor CD22 isoform X2 [Myxocyprinus asiaticus]